MRSCRAAPARGAHLSLTQHTPHLSLALPPTLFLAPPCFVPCFPPAHSCTDPRLYRLCCTRMSLAQPPFAPDVIGPCRPREHSEASNSPAVDSATVNLGDGLTRSATRSNEARPRQQQPRSSSSPHGATKQLKAAPGRGGSSSNGARNSASPSMTLSKDEAIARELQAELDANEPRPRARELRSSRERKPPQFFSPQAQTSSPASPC